MEIFRIAAIALVTAFCALVLRDIKSELAVLVAFAGGIIVILSVVDYFSDIFSVISSIAKRAGIAASVVTLIFKVIAVGYIAGKLIIVASSLPTVVKLFEFIAEMLS